MADKTLILRRYLSREAAQIWGNLHPVDGACFAAILHYQNVTGVRGGAAEIGVFFGRSAFLIAKAMNPGERLFLIDLFDVGQTGDSRPQLDAFKARARKLGVVVDPKDIWIGPSDTVISQDITSRVGEVRFFSVDGGHMSEHLQNDSELALETLSKDGVIAFDDVFNPEWPETTLGVFEFLKRRRSEVAPFAQTKDKLFVCRIESAEQYRNALEVSSWTRGFRFRRTSIEGRDIAWIHHEVSDRIIYRVLEKVGAPQMAYQLQTSRKYK